jgi:hypothetical protein
VFRQSTGRHALTPAKRRLSFRRDVAPSLAIAFVAMLFAWPLFVPHSSDAAAWFSADGDTDRAAQLTVIGAEAGIVRDDDWSVTQRFAQAPATGTPNPGSSQMIAYQKLVARGYQASEFDCLNALWSKESGWNHFAHNKSSGAYGIPQSLPGEKMASAGDDWATNPETQIRWGLGYIEARYGTPCGAWDHFVRRNWY